MRILSSLACALIATSALGQHPARPNYQPYPLDTLYFDQAASVEVVAIVRAQAHREEPRPRFDRTFDRTPQARRSLTSVEHATVIDGVGVRAGADVDLAAPQAERVLGGSGNSRDPRPGFVPGKAYLVLGLHAVGGRLRMPFAIRGPESVSEGESMKATSMDEISLLNAFPTDALTLPTATSPKDRLVKALIQAIPAAKTDWDMERLMDLLWQSDREIPEVTKENDYTRLLHGIAGGNADRVARFNAQALLVKWHVVGSRAPFVAMLLDVADDPSFPVSVNHLPAGVVTLVQGKLSPDYPIHFDQARCNYLAATARNEELRHYLFRECAWPSTTEEWTRFVKDLDREPRNFVDILMLDRFALWSGLKDKAPVIKLLPGKALAECINHDELVAYWKSVYP